MPFIRRIAKTAAVVLPAFFVCAILFIGIYDQCEFRPFAGKIEAVYQRMGPEDRQPPANVQNFVWKVDSRVVDSFAARKLLYDVRGPMRMSTWHYHSLMWELMLHLHFDRAKRLAFYCYYLPYEQGSGFSNAAQFYFGKPPHELTDDQLAALVAIGRSPSINSPTRHPETLERAKARLLETYAAPQ